MRYLGSKTLLLDEIAKLVEAYGKQGVFCDPFGGIGTVGSFMKSKGYQIVTGDILNFAHCFQVSLIENCTMPEFLRVKHEFGIEDVERYLNTQVSERGWLIDEYALKRKYFTLENAIHIQGCIDCINDWNNRKLLQEGEYLVLVASLIQSFDKVANTAGTYYAYLKDFYRKANNQFKYSLINPTAGVIGCKAYLLDANKLVKRQKCDILYLDPPYNERNYSRYYHLPETISLGIEPEPKGKSGVYVYQEIESAYNRKMKATEAFEDLIKSTDAKCIIFHYTDNGIIKCDDARDILMGKGKSDEFYFDCKGYNTVSGEKNSQHHIFRVMC